MWELQPTDDYERRLRHFAKKHPAELVQALDNLDTYLVALKSGALPNQIKFGFIHVEGQGIVAIDQKGGPRNLKQTRLYVLPDVSTCTVHQITIGDKNTQSADLAVCREFVKTLRRTRSDEGNTTVQERSATDETDSGDGILRGRGRESDCTTPDHQATHGSPRHERDVAGRRGEEDGLHSEPNIET